MLKKSQEEIESIKTNFKNLLESEIQDSNFIKKFQGIAQITVPNSILTSEPSIVILNGVVFPLTYEQLVRLSFNLKSENNKLNGKIQELQASNILLHKILKQLADEIYTFNVDDAEILQAEIQGFQQKLKPILQDKYVSHQETAIWESETFLIPESTVKVFQNLMQTINIKTREYENLIDSSKSQLSLNNLLTTQLDQTLAENNFLQSQIQANLDLLAQLTSENIQLKEQLKKVNLANDEKVAKANQSRDDLRKQLKLVSEKLCAEEEKSVALETRIQELEKEASKRTVKTDVVDISQLQKLQDQLKTQKDVNSGLQKTIKQHEQEIQELRANNKKQSILVDENARQQEEILSLRKIILERDRKLELSTAREQNLSSAYENLLRKLTKDFSAASEQAEQERENNDELRQRLIQINSKLLSIRSKENLNLLEQSLEESEALRLEQEEELKKAYSEINDLQKRLSTINSQYFSRQHEMSKENILLKKSLESQDNLLDQIMINLCNILIKHLILSIDNFRYKQFHADIVNHLETTLFGLTPAWKDSTVKEGLLKQISQLKSEMTKNNSAYQSQHHRHHQQNKKSWSGVVVSSSK